MDTHEEWRSVEGCEGSYEVSNLGNLRSLPRLNKRGRKLSGGPLAQHINANGYRKVGLWYKEQAKVFSVARLVAYAFIPNPLSKPQVNHIDGNKQNNHVSNLEWVTNYENSLHAARTGLNVVVFGESNGRARLTREIVEEARKKAAAGENGPSLAKMFNCDPTTINRAISGKSWPGLAVPPVVGRDPRFKSKVLHQRLEKGSV